MTEKLYRTLPAARLPSRASEDQEVDPNVETEETPGEDRGFLGSVADFGRDVYERGQAENWVLPSLSRAVDIDYSVDPNFDMPEVEELDERFRELDVDPNQIPPETFAQLGGARNADELDRRIGRVKEQVESRQELAENGTVRSFMVDLASFAIDPVALGADFLTGGTARGARMARFMQGGTRALAAHSVVEAGLMADRESPSLEQVSAGMATAFGLGGVVGATFGRNLSRANAAQESIADGVEAVGKQEIPRAKWNEEMQRWEEVDIDPLNDTPKKRKVRLNPETGKWEDSAGAARVEGSGGGTDIPTFRRADTLSDLEDILSATPDSVARNSGAFRAVRWDKAGQMARSDHKATRQMSLKAYSNPTQRKGETQKMSWTERARKNWEGEDGARARVQDRAFTKWIKRTTGKGRVRSFFAHDERDEFFREVGRYIRNRGNIEVDPEVKEAAEAQKQFFQGLLKRMKDNKVPGADLIEADEWYLPRILSRQNVNKTMSKLDAGGSVKRPHEHLEELFEGALKAGRKRDGMHVDDALTRVVAKAYARRALGVDDKGSKAFSMGEIEGFDLQDTSDLRRFIRDQVDNETLTSDEVAKADAMLDEIEKLTRRSDKDAASADLPDRLQQRLKMDETFEMDVELADGSTQRLSIGDLFEDNSEMLSFNYGRWAGGESALAYDGFSTAQFKKLIDEGRALAQTKKDAPEGNESLPTETDVDLWERAFTDVMGLRPDDWGEHGRRGINMLKSASFIRSMGSSAVNAVVEGFTVPAAVGLGRTLRNMPAMKQIMKSMSGKNPDMVLVRQAQMLNAGTGATFVRNTQGRMHELESTNFGNDLFGRAERFVEGAKRTASYFNMLSRVTDVTRDFAAVNALSLIDDVLVRGLRKPSYWDNRAKSWSLSDERQELIRKYLKSGNVKRSADGALEDLGNMPPAVREAMEDYVFRFTTEMIQDIDKGNLPRFMDNPFMNMILQFRSFEMASTVRHTLKDSVQMDSLALNKFLITSSMATVAYMGRVHAFKALTPDERDEMLTPRRAILTGISYSVNAGIMPTVVDSISQRITGGDPFFNPYGRRTSGIESGLLSLDAAPAIANLRDAEKLTDIPGRLLRGGHGVDTPLSSTEMGSILGITGMSTMWFTRPFAEYLQANADDQDRDSNDKIDLWDD